MELFKSTHELHKLQLLTVYTTIKASIFELAENPRYFMYKYSY